MSATDVHGIYDPGVDITALATAAVIGRRFVSVSGDRDASGGPANGLVKMQTTAAGARAHGVARYDAASGQPFTVARGNSRVVEVTADNAAIAAGADVMVGLNGTAKTWVSPNVAVGFAITGATANGTAQISLY